jgi:hypothetical protein
VGTPARFDPLDVTKEESLAAVGVGKLEVLEFRDALAVAGQGEGRLACNQVLYHLQERAFEHAVLPWCREAWCRGHGVRSLIRYHDCLHDNFSSVICLFAGYVSAIKGPLDI